MRLGAIATEELKLKNEQKAQNALFCDKIESDPRLLIIVAPDKSVESIDGSVPIDTMTNVNFRR